MACFVDFLHPQLQPFFFVAPAFFRGPMRGRAIFAFLNGVAYMKSKKEIREAGISVILEPATFALKTDNEAVPDRDLNPVKENQPQKYDALPTELFTALWP